jgi:hypothetical protein
MTRSLLLSKLTDQCIKFQGSAKLLKLFMEGVLKF